MNFDYELGKLRLNSLTNEIPIKRFDKILPFIVHGLASTPLRGCVSVLEIVFVGQCEVFFCHDFA